MSDVRVYNDNSIRHEEKFKGDMVVIESKGFIEMNRDEAVLFKSQFYPPKFDAGNQQTIESMKCIRLAPIVAVLADVEVEKELHDCMLCGDTGFKSLAGLASHTRSKHPDVPMTTEKA